MTQFLLYLNCVGQVEIEQKDKIYRNVGWFMVFNATFNNI